MFNKLNNVTEIKCKNNHCPEILPSVLKPNDDCPSPKLIQTNDPCVCPYVVCENNINRKYFFGLFFLRKLSFINRSINQLILFIAIKMVINDKNVVQKKKKNEDCFENFNNVYLLSSCIDCF